MKYELKIPSESSGLKSVVTVSQRDEGDGLWIEDDGFGRDCIFIPNAHVEALRNYLTTYLAESPPATP
jgi:hypothetical protein